MKDEIKNGFLPIGIIIAIMYPVLLLLITPHGIGLSPDSVQYIKYAKSLVYDHTLVGITTHWPPGYPLLLGFTNLFIHNMLLTVRLISALCGGLCLLAGTFILHNFALQKGHSKFICTLGLLWLAIMPGYFTNHIMAWSEGPFIAALLWITYFLVKFIQFRKFFYLIAIAALCSFLILLRYAAAPFILVTFILLIYTCRTQSKMIRAIVMAFVLAAIPLFLWSSYTSLILAKESTREITFHLIGLTKIKEGLVTLSNWFFPWNFYSLGTVLLILGVGVIFIYEKKNGSSSASQFYHVSLIFNCGYLLFLLFSISFFDAYTPLDNRILSPLWPFIALSLTLFLATVQNHNWRMRLVASMILLVLCLVQIPGFKHLADLSQNSGIAFASKHFKKSQLLFVMKEVAVAPKIYSNLPELVTLYTRFDAELLPSHYSPISLLANPNYEVKINEVKKEILSGEAIILFFYSGQWRRYLPSRDYLTHNLGLPLLLSTRDGLLFADHQLKSEILSTTD